VACFLLRSSARVDRAVPDEELNKMADKRRSTKLLKKDSAGPREVRDEIVEEITSSATQPRQKNPNRDRARGDWDRTGLHHDEGMSRSEEEA
jgi:hypothetical protein